MTICQCVEKYSLYMVKRGKHCSNYNTWKVFTNKDILILSVCNILNYRTLILILFSFSNTVITVRVFNVLANNFKWALRSFCMVSTCVVTFTVPHYCAKWGTHTCTCIWTVNNQSGLRGRPLDCVLGPSLLNNEIRGLSHHSLLSWPVWLLLIDNL